MFVRGYIQIFNFTICLYTNTGTHIFMTCRIIIIVCCCKMNHKIACNVDWGFYQLFNWISISLNNVYNLHRKPTRLKLWFLSTLYVPRKYDNRFCCFFFIWLVYVINIIFCKRTKFVDIFVFVLFVRANQILKITQSNVPINILNRLVDRNKILIVKIDFIKKKKLSNISMIYELYMNY